MREGARVVAVPGKQELQELLGSVRKVLRRRAGKAKTAEEAECTGVHEHSEAVFSAAWTSIKAFRTEPRAALPPFRDTRPLLQKAETFEHRVCILA